MGLVVEGAEVEEVPVEDWGAVVPVVLLELVVGEDEVVCWVTLTGLLVAFLANPLSIKYRNS